MKHPGSGPLFFPAHSSNHAEVGGAEKDKNMTTTSTKAKRIYTIQNDGSKPYGTLSIRVLELDGYRHNEVITLTWQNTWADNAAVWYGFRVEVRTRDHGAVEQLKLAASLLPKLLLSGNSPACVIDALATLKIERAEFDGRVNGYVLEREVMDVSIVKYMDNVNSEGCHAHGFAAIDDVDEARRQIQRNWSKLISEGSWGADAGKFASWIAAGKPVRRSEWDKAPTFASLDTLLCRPVAKVEAVA